MSILVRDATEADLQGILEIYNDAIRTTLSVFTEQEVSLDERRTWFQQRRKANYPVLVATSSAGVLGFSTFGDFRAWPGYRKTVENSVFVRSDARRQGIGAKLVSPLLARAEALDKHVMIAGIEAANIASVTLHERLGFEKVGLMREVAEKFGRPLDLLFMQRFVKAHG